MKRLITALFSLMLLTIATMSTAQTYITWELPANGFYEASGNGLLRSSGPGWSFETGVASSTQTISEGEAIVWQHILPGHNFGVFLSPSKPKSFILKDNNENNTWIGTDATVPFGVLYSMSGTSGQFRAFEAGAFVGSDITGSVLSWVRINYVNATTVTYQHSADGENWTTFHTSAGDPSGTYYVMYEAYSQYAQLQTAYKIAIGGGGGGNQPPSITPIGTQTVTLPNTSTTLSATATDSDGTIASYSWIKVSGPSGGSLGTPTQASTSVTGLVEGTYTYRVTVTDDDGSTTSADATIIVQSGQTGGGGSNGNITPAIIPLSADMIMRHNAGIEDWNMQNTVPVPNATNPQLPKTSYFRWNWYEVETGQGVWDWNLFDRPIREAIDNGQTFAFGVMTLNPDCGTAWYSGKPRPTDQGACMTYPVYLHQLMQGETANSRDWMYNGIWVPNYNSPNYLARVKAMYDSIYNHLNTTYYKGVLLKHVIEYFENRQWGSWGEGHHYPYIDAPTGWPSGRNPSVPAVDSIMAYTVRAFPDVWTVAPFSILDAYWLGNTWTDPAITKFTLMLKNASGQFMGLRRDHAGVTDFGYTWDYDVTINNNRGYTNPSGYTNRNANFPAWTGTPNTPAGPYGIDTASMNRWKIAPMVNEPYGSKPAEETRGEGANLPKEARFWHFNSFGNGNFGLSYGSNSASGFNFDSVRLAAKLSGHRLQINSGNITAPIISGGGFNISLQWQNIGLAPVYERYHVIFELRTTGGATVWSDTSAFNPYLFLPASTATNVTDAFSLGAVPVGYYNLFVKIKDVYNYRMPLPLAIQGRTADGSYLLASNIQVLSTGGGGNQAPTVTITGTSTVNLPTATGSLTASATDPDGSIASYAWTQTAGPNTATIASPTAATTAISGLVEGIYTFQVIVTDNGGLTALASRSVTVSAPSSNFSFTEIPFTDPEIRQYDRGAEDWNMMEYIVDIPTQGGNTQPKNFYWRYKWHKLEGAQGVYDFSEMESHIRQCMDRRQRFSFGIMHLYVGDWESPPQAGGYSMSYPLYLHNLMQAEAANSRDYVSGNWWVPNVNSPNYLTRMDSLHANVYRFLNNNSYQPAWASAPIKYKDIVTYVDMRGHGNWGEWNLVDVHNNYTEFPTGRRPTYQSLRRIIQSHETYFPDLQLVALVGAFDSEYLGNVWNPPALAGYLADTAQNLRGKVGIRRDDWGDPWSWHVAWTYENNRHYIRDTAVGYFIGNMWKYAPIVGEPASDAWYNGGYSFFPGQVDEFHITSFGEGNYYLGNLTGSMADYFREASKKSGYRIVLTGGNVANTLQSGAPFTLTVNWQNKGVAPVYHEWIPYYELRNASNQVVHTWKADWNLRFMQPSATPVAKSQILTMPAGIPNGTYSLRMVIRDSVGYAEPFILNIQGRGSDGSYLLRSGITVSNTGTVNQAPTVSINDVGQTNTITLPTSTFNLTSTAVDPDGSIASYAWTKISGPTATISTPTTASSAVTITTAGVYVFQLVVTDNGGLTASAQKTITVLNPPAPPVANAGADSTIQLPKSWVTLIGSGTDPDGTISSYSWAKVSGPSASIVSPTSATTRLENLVAGTYVFRLTVTDNTGSTGTDDVTVIVQQPANVPPVANAGADSTVQLPNSTSTLIGSGTDSDGTIVSYSWSKISGPAGGSLLTPQAATSVIQNLQAGTYVFRLTVTDNNGATGSDDVSVTVNVFNPVNQEPIANAGPNQTITVALGQVTLDGRGSYDPDGYITQHTWIKLSGPSSGTILSPNNVVTLVTGLVQGNYTFRLIVTDDQGVSRTDDIDIIVNPSTFLRPKYRVKYGGRRSSTDQ